MAKRLREAGFPEQDLQLIVPHERKGNLVARLRGGARRKPLLLLGYGLAILTRGLAADNNLMTKTAAAVAAATAGEIDVITW